MARREDIHLFEENLTEKKKKNLVFTTPGGSYCRLLSNIRLWEPPPTTDCPLFKELSCHSPWSPLSSV